MADQEIARLIIRIIGEVGEVKKQLADVQKATKETADQTKTHVESMKGTLGMLKTEWVALTAAAYAAYAGISKAFQWAELGAKAEAIAESFGYVTKSIGVDGKKLIADIKQISGVYEDSTDIMLVANKLLVAGIPAGDIVRLFESARVGARLMGIGVEEAMELITRAVLTFAARGLLKQAFPMEMEKVFERYADKMKIDVDMITEFGKQSAVVQEILRQTQTRMQFLGDVTIPNNYEKMQKLASTYKEGKELIGTFVVDALPLFLSGMEKQVGLVVSWQMILESTWSTMKGITTTIGEFFGLVSKAPPIVAKVASTGATPTKAVFAIEEGKAGIDRQISDQDKLQKALTKLRLDAEKARVDATGQIQMLGLEAQHSQALKEAMLAAKDTFEIDQKFQRDKAEMELKNTLASLKAQENAEVAAAISDKKIREIPAIKEKIRQAELVAEGKYNAEVDKINLDRVTKEKERTLALAAASTKEEISIQQSYLDRLQDLFERNRITVELYYAKRRDIVVAIGTTEIQNLQQELDARGDIAKEAGLYAQIVEKTAKLEKDLLGIERDRYNDIQKLADLNLDIFNGLQDRRKIMIDMARKELTMGPVEAINEQISLEVDLQAKLKERLVLVDQITDPKKYSDFLTQIAQSQGKVNDLFLQSQERTGTFIQGWEKGVKEVGEQLPTAFQMGKNAVNDFLNAVTNPFKSFFDNLTSGTMSAKDAFKKLADDMAKNVMNMLVDIGMLILKMEILKSLGYGTAGGGGGGSWLSALLGLVGGGGGTTTTVGSFIGEAGIISVLQHGGAVTGPSGKDVVPIRATAGEYVIQESAVRKYGPGFMSMINEGLLDISKLIGLSSRSQPSLAFASGGLVSNISPSIDQRTALSIINVVDPRELDRYLASAGGQNAILNVLSSRAMVVKKILQ